MGKKEKIQNKIITNVFALECNTHFKKILSTTAENLRMISKRKSENYFPN